MPATPPDLIVRLEDVHGELLAEQADILLWDLRTGADVRKTAPKGKPASIAGLSTGPPVVYRMEIDPPSYLPVRMFVNVHASEKQNVTVVLPADPAKVAPLFSEYALLDADCCGILERSHGVTGFAGRKGADLFGDLNLVEKAGLLNVLCKCDNTALVNSRTVLSYLEQVYEVRGDRSFFIVNRDLREQVKSSASAGLFNPAPDNLHHPPPGYSKAGSWKTPDRYANLQLTFWCSLTAPSAWRADIDIDDAGGFEHVFQVVRNTITGLPTHPYAIHQLLVRHQRLAPSYRLAPL